MAPDKHYLEKVLNDLSDQKFIKTQWLDDVTKEVIIIDG